MVQTGAPDLQPELKVQLLLLGGPKPVGAKTNHVLDANHSPVSCPGQHQRERSRLVWELGVHWFVSEVGCDIRPMLSHSLHLTGWTNGDFYPDE
jgi:hypothetical protein